MKRRRRRRPAQDPQRSPVKYVRVLPSDSAIPPETFVQGGFNPECGCLFAWALAGHDWQMKRPLDKRVIRAGDVEDLFIHTAMHHLMMDGLHVTHRDC